MSGKWAINPVFFHTEWTLRESTWLIDYTQNSDFKFLFFSGEYPTAKKNTHRPKAMGGFLSLISPTDLKTLNHIGGLPHAHVIENT